MSTALPPIAPPAAAPTVTAPGDPVRAPSGDDRDFDVALELAAASLVAAKPVPPAIVLAPVAPQPAESGEAAELAALLAASVADAPPPAPAPAWSAAEVSASWADLLRASSDAASRSAAHEAKPFLIDMRPPTPVPAPPAPVAIEALAPATDAAGAATAAPVAPAAQGMPSSTELAENMRVLSSSMGARGARPRLADANDAPPRVGSPDAPVAGAPAPRPASAPSTAAAARADALAHPATEAALRAALAAEIGERVLGNADEPSTPVVATPAVERGALPVDATEAQPATVAVAERLARLGRLLEHVRAVLARAVTAEPEGSGASAPATMEPMNAGAQRIAPAAPMLASFANAAAPGNTPAPAPATPAPLAATAPTSTGSAPQESAKPVSVDPDASRRDGDARPAPAEAGITAEAPATNASPAAVTEVRGANAGEHASRSTGVRAPVAATAPELPAPNPGERVTLRFDGEGGVSGRIRLSMRGETLHATIVPTGPGFESAGNLDELRRLLADRGFAEARVAVQDAVSQAGLPPGSQSSQGPPRDDARREAFARAHEERGQSESQGRPGRQRPRHPEEEKA